MCNNYTFTAWQIYNNLFFSTMKNLLFLISLSLLGLVACNKDEEVKLDFDITVPENWSYFVLANEGNVYYAVRNQESPSDTVLESLYISKQSLPDYSLTMYYNALAPIIKESELYRSQIYQSDTVINDTDFKKLISREIFRVVTTGIDTFNFDVITERYFFFENNYGYNMAFFTADTAYAESREVFGDIMGSFQYHY